MKLALAALLVSAFCNLITVESNNLRATSPLQTAAVNQKNQKNQSSRKGRLVQNTKTLTLTQHLESLSDEQPIEKLEVEREVAMRSRKLIRDVDMSKVCFVDRGNDLAEADYYNNPFLANNDRGDWGKCMPHEVFGILCEHMATHMINNGQWLEGDGPLHDAPSEQLWPALMKKHDDNCFHLDVNFPPETQEFLNTYLRYEGIFQEEEGEEGSLFDAVFNVKAISGKYWLNGHQNPALTFQRGGKYTFVYDSDAVRLGHPFRIGTAVHVEYSVGLRMYPNNVTFTVPMDAPADLVYYCVYHRKDKDYY